MLQDSDLKSFLHAFEAASRSDVEAVQPRNVLSNAAGIFHPEIWRLVCSLQIASVAGDAPQVAAGAAQIILDDIKGERCVSPSDTHSWAQAIAWALKQPALADPNARSVPLGRERERVVGEACARLRRRGYRIEIGAYGPQLAEASRREIVQSAEALVGLLGGIETATQVFRFLRDTNRYHDGLWLFGEVGLNLYDNKSPMIPVGLLLSLALRNFDRPNSARKPQQAWKSLIELSRDFGAAHDCQRYSQFEGMDLHASQIHRALATSTLWRELFTLPQMPATALYKVLDSLAATLTREDEDELGFGFAVLSREIVQLVESAANDRPSAYSLAGMKKKLPLLWSLTGRTATKLKPHDANTAGVSERAHDNLLIFECGRDRAAIMPRSILATAACEFIFELIWLKLKKRAADVVGQTLENAIATACQGKAETVLSRQTYQANGRRYEIDVATRDEDRIVLIETKGKMLTRQSRSGDMFAFFRDYSDSFLRMLSQLVRHEVHLRQALTPLTAASENVDDFRPLKVAVSPLSYGPVSDKMFASSVIRSLVGARFTLVVPDEANQRTIDAFNKRAETILADMALVAPKREGLADLFPYFIDVFWLDFGQLLYILDRANSVWDAFRPLKHITFSSRDFWMELAQADRGGLTTGKWRPVTG